jgi:tRNA G18 (ribose-2'-O)-methylase SpoU
VSVLAKFAKNAIVDSDQIIIEGMQPFELYQQTGGTIHQIVIDEHLDSHNFSNIAPTFVTTRGELTQHLGFRFHGGLMALADRPKLKMLDDIQFPALYLNRITSPENVGSLARLAAGLGFKSLIFDYESCHPYTRRCIRVSIGNIFSLNVYKSSSYQEFFEHTKDFNLVALEINDRSESIYENDWYKLDNLCLIVGGEGPGVHPVLLERAMKILHIPQALNFSSLNVSHAAAIAMSYRLSKTGH